MKTYHLPSGPKIQVSLTGQGDYLEKVKLLPADSFSYQVDERLKPEAQDQLHTWLKEYSLSKSPTSSLPLPDLRHPPFTKKVLDMMRGIPFGAVESYRSLAVLSGSPRAARAVGNICRCNLFPLFIPCHRVLSSDGTLCGFAFGLIIKEELLRFEKAI